MNANIWLFGRVMCFIVSVDRLNVMKLLASNYSIFLQWLGDVL